MRRPTPALIVTSVVLALAALPAAAQTTRPGTGNATVGTATGTTPRVVAGGCRGTNGSTCNAVTTSTPTATPGTGTSAPSETLPGNNVTSSNNATGTTNNATGTTNNATGTTTNNATGTTTNNATGTTNNATGPFNNATGPSDATAADFNNNQRGPLADLVRNNGTTVGTTGNASPNGTNTENGTGTIGNSFFVPGLAGTPGTDSGAMADAGNGVNANGERVSGGRGNAASNGGGAAPNTLVTGNTLYALPLYDATTKAATARDLRRRAARQEPRIIGLAPRTNADLAYQMPDDRIIRY